MPAAQANAILKRVVSLLVVAVVARVGVDAVCGSQRLPMAAPVVAARRPDAFMNRGEGDSGRRPTVPSRGMRNGEKKRVGHNRGGSERRRCA